MGDIFHLKRLAAGADILAVNRDPHPASLGFLPGLEAIRVQAELPAGYEREFDLVAMLECPDLDRPSLGRLAILEPVDPQTRVQ